MKYKIIVDKQPRTNPSTEKQEYEIEIEELRCKGDVADSLIITKDEDYVMRRLSLSEYHVLSVLAEPVKETLEQTNIKLFEGDNYIYIQDMVGNKFYAEYLVKNDFTDTYVTKNQMNSAINETAEKIELSVTKTLEGYATTEKMNSKITQTADKINLEVSKKVNDEELTGANIALRINNDESEAQINADKININGAISANGNFKVDKDGNMECQNGKFDGNINLTNVENNGDRFSIKGSFGDFILNPHGFAFYANPLGSKYVVLDMSEAGCPNITLGNNLSENPPDETTVVSAIEIMTPKLTQTSREETKKNFEKLENGLDIVKATEIYKYNLKNEEDTKKKHIGFVIGKNYKYAHEITAEDNEGKEIGVDTYSMVSVLWKAVQELTTKVEKLEQEVQNGKN